MNHLLEKIKQKNASAFTHSGKFHADDVFSAALLLYLNPEITITRGNQVPENYEGLVFDIGRGQYDHHQNPEIPVNVYDLGLIYKIDVSDSGEAVIDMTLTAPNCPAADFIMEDVRQKVESIDGVESATVNLVFEPEWDKDMMSEEAKLELGFL